jgi:hypothetical protein
MSEIAGPHIQIFAADSPDYSLGAGSNHFSESFRESGGVLSNTS